MDKTKKYPINLVRICVDDLNGTMVGRAYTQMNTETINFNGVQQLLLKLDEVFNNACFPQAFHEQRSFSDEKNNKVSYLGIPKPVRKISLIINNEGILSSFDVIVESRRNSSWQGTVCQINTDRKCCFNSDMQLIQFLENKNSSI